jgi:hypothetical protein
MKRFIGLLALFIIFLLPHNIFAACSTTGYTVVYINGINTKSESDAQDDKRLLNYEFSKHSNIKNVNFLTGYNPSHIAGLGDVVETVSQILNNPISNYDRDTILLKIYPEVTTRKILLVGHSQGTFYTNEIYDYLIAHGVPKESIGVYNIATPASSVGGYEKVPNQGAYLTSSNDKVINLVRNLALATNAKLPLSANIIIPLTLQEAADSFGGHSFSGVYLANESVRIVSEIENALKKLSTTGTLEDTNLGCFVPPEKGLTYYAQQSVLSVADSAVSDIVAVSKGIATVGEFVYKGTSDTLAQVINTTKGLLLSVTSVFKNNAQIPNQNLLAEVSLSNDTFQSAAKGINDPGLVNQTAQDNLNLIDENSSSNNFEVANLSEKPIAEEIDQDNAQEITQNVSSSTKNKLLTEVSEMPKTNGVQQQNIKACSFETTKTATHQNLLINEVAWMGSKKSANDEWIELKNISDSELNISNWQILDKGEQIKITIPVNTKIAAGGFLFMERTDDNSVPNTKADIIYVGALSNSNEGLRLFDNQCNLIDEVFADSVWPAGDSGAKATMERQANLTWSTYGGAGEGSGDGLILGTPKKENSIKTVSYGGGGTATPVNNEQAVADSQQSSTKILISEIQAYPTQNRFIELYNPGNSPVNLTDWYIQRKTQTGSSFSSLVSKTYFDGKTIGAHGFFLISRESLAGADVVLGSLTLTESNSIQLKNTNGEVVDKVGWGVSDSCEGSCAVQISDNQSIQRKIQNNDFIDTDNNANDFEARSCPSPKSQSASCAVSEANESNQAPSAFFDFSPIQPKINEEIIFNSASSTDPDGNIILYDWNFGDGYSASTTQATTTHSYILNGNYEVGLVVYDNKNATSTASTTISINIPKISIEDTNFLLLNQQNSDGDVASGMAQVFKPLADGILDSVETMTGTSGSGWSYMHLAVYSWTGNASSTPSQSKGVLLATSASKQIWYNTTYPGFSGLTWNFEDTNKILLEAGKYYYIQVETESSSLDSAPSIRWKISNSNDLIDGDGWNGTNSNDLYLVIRAANQGIISLTEPINNNVYYDQNINYKIKYLEPVDKKYSSITIETKDFFTEETVNNQTIVLSDSEQTLGWHEISGNFSVNWVGYFKAKISLSDSIKSEINLSVFGAVPADGKLLNQNNYSTGVWSNFLSGQVFRPAVSGKIDSLILQVNSGGSADAVQSDNYWNIYEWNGDGNNLIGSAGMLLATTTSQYLVANSYPGQTEVTWDFDSNNEIYLDSSKYYFLSWTVVPRVSNGLTPTLYMKSSTNGSLIDGRMIAGAGYDGDLYLVLNKKSD